METHWVAYKDITVKGGIVRKKGEHVPEADEWKNPESWVRAGHIRLKDGPPPSPSKEDTRQQERPPTPVEAPQAPTPHATSGGPGDPNAEKPPEDKPVLDLYGGLKRNFSRSKLQMMRKADLQALAGSMDIDCGDAKRLEIVDMILDRQG